MPRGGVWGFWGLMCLHAGARNMKYCPKGGREEAMEKFDELSRRLERQGKTEDIKNLAQSEESRRLAAMVDAGAIEAAAKRGDEAALRNILSGLLSTNEGRKLAENVKKLMED